MRFIPPPLLGLRCSAFITAIINGKLSLIDLAFLLSQSDFEGDEEIYTDSDGEVQCLA